MFAWAAMVPVIRRQNKKGEGKLKWERAKEFLWPMWPLPLSYYGADKPHIVCKIISDMLVTLGLCLVGTLTLSILAFHLLMAATHSIPVNSILYTLGAGVGPHLGRFGPGPTYFQGLPIVTLVLQGKHWFLESEPTGLNPNSVCKWMSNLSQITNHRWHGIGLWSDC